MDRKEGPHAFNRFLAMLGDGAAHAEVSAHLHELGIALEREADAQQKKVAGELTLKISLTCEPNGVVGANYEIKRKEPAPRRPGSIFWLTKGGNLTPENPRQQKLPLREVMGERTDVRDLDEHDHAREV